MFGVHRQFTSMYSLGVLSAGGIFGVIHHEVTHFSKS